MLGVCFIVDMWVYLEARGMMWRICGGVTWICGGKG